MEKNNFEEWFLRQLVDALYTISCLINQQNGGITDSVTIHIPVAREREHSSV